METLFIFIFVAMHGGGICFAALNVKYTLWPQSMPQMVVTFAYKYIYIYLDSKNLEIMSRSSLPSSYSSLVLGINMRKPVQVVVINKVMKCDRNGQFENG